MDAAIDDGLAIEEAAFARIVLSHDAREGVAHSSRSVRRVSWVDNTIMTEK